MKMQPQLHLQAKGAKPAAALVVKPDKYTDTLGCVAVASLVQGCEFLASSMRTDWDRAETAGQVRAEFASSARTFHQA